MGILDKLRGLLKPTKKIYKPVPRRTARIIPINVGKPGDDDKDKSKDKGHAAPDLDPSKKDDNSRKGERFEHCVFLDAGHGGIDPEGKYTTEPGKMFVHGDGKKYHNGTTFYEGVKNREYCELIGKLLEQRGIRVVKVYHPYKDNPLHYRTGIANLYHKNIQKGIYLSEHSNAISNPLHNAQGFCLYTSKGETMSDKLANIYGKAIKKNLSNVIKYRVSRDGELDHEANFYVLRKTDMPSILFENLFFDNPLDADKLISESYKQRYCKVIADATVTALRYLEKQK